MNKDKQRIALAEVCGKTIPPYVVEEEYVDDPHWNGGFWQSIVRFQDGKTFTCYLKRQDVKKGGWEAVYASEMFPDYLNDLNAIREIEKTLTDIQAVAYERELVIVMLKTWKQGDKFGNHGCWHASAAQRAEALLRTLGKWEEST